MKAKKPIAGTPEGAPRWIPIAGALVGIAGLVWAIVSFFLKPEPTAKPPAIEQQAEAIGGTAINAAGSAKVSNGGDSPLTSAHPPASEPSDSTRQSAKAASGGTAVNATNSAEVNIKKP